jgi:hypothetical protein
MNINNLLRIGIFFLVVNPSWSQSRWPCTNHLQIYCQLNNNSGIPQNDPSSLIYQNPLNNYESTPFTTSTGTVILQNLRHPNSVQYAPQALRNQNIQLNGIALNPQDGYVYGFDVLHGNRLVRIGQNGVIRLMGIPSGTGNNAFPQNSLTNYSNYTGIVGAACFDNNGTLYVAVNDRDPNNTSNSRSRIYSLTGITNAPIYNNGEPSSVPVSIRRFTDENADNGINDLLFQIPANGSSNLTTLYVSLTNSSTVRGIKLLPVSGSNAWIYGNNGAFIFDSQTAFDNAGIVYPNTNIAIGGRSTLGLSYNPATNSYVGVTGAQQEPGTNNFYRILFTFDSCGMLQSWTLLAGSVGTGDGTSIFPR